MGVGDSVVLSDVGCTMSASQRSVARRVPPLWVLKALVTGEGITGADGRILSRKAFRRVGELGS